MMWTLVSWHSGSLGKTYEATSLRDARRQAKELIGKTYRDELDLTRRGTIIGLLPNITLDTPVDHCLITYTESYPI